MDVRQKALNIRSGVMAETVRWILETESVDNLAVWAHNNHVNRGPFADGRFGDDAALGEWLARTDGLTYVAIGSSVGEETVRCYSMETEAFEAVERRAAPTGKVADVLLALEDGPFFVDLRSL